MPQSVKLKSRTDEEQIEANDWNATWNPKTFKAHFQLLQFTINRSCCMLGKIKNEPVSWTYSNSDAPLPLPHSSSFDCIQLLFQRKLKSWWNINIWWVTVNQSTHVIVERYRRQTNDFLVKERKSFLSDVNVSTKSNDYFDRCCLHSDAIARLNDLP